MGRAGRIGQPFLIFGNIVNQPLGGFPSKTGIGDGLSIHAVPHLLVSLFYITLYHDTLYQIPDVGIQLPAVHDLLYNTDLLVVLLGGITVICVDDGGRVFQVPLIVKVEQ